MLESDGLFFEMASKKGSSMRRRIDRDYSTAINLITAMCNAHFSLLRQTVGLMNLRDFTGRSSLEPILFSALYKNSFSFYSALNEVRCGMHGQAMVLARPVFESLFLSKFCYITNDISMFKKWEAGEYINIVNFVLNRIKGSEMTESRELLKILNRLSHHSVNSGQVTLDYASEREPIDGALGILVLLATASHHLLNRHFLTPKLKYQMNRCTEDGKFEEYLRHSTNMYNASRKSFTKVGKLFIREYSAKWIL